MRYYPSDLSQAERRVVAALAEKQIVVAVRRKWWIKGAKRPLDDRSVASVVGKGLASLSGNRVSAVPATHAMARMLERHAARLAP